MQLIHIALDRLSVSPTNMRDGRKPPDIGDLLPSVRARGVLVPLLVRPAPEPDRFEIVAGRRRFFAARTLAEEGGAAEPLPCAIIAAGDDAAALEASLIENIARLAPHEVEQWEVFTRLVVKEHRQIDDIAATFGVEPLQVRRALALGNLLPKIREAYRAEVIDAATVRHLTLATKAQQKDWLALFADPDAYAPTGHQLKAWLFGGQPIPTAHALFDLAAYPGQIVADLFGEGGYFADAAAFWEAQNAAVAARRDAYLEAGWREVVIVPPDAYWQSWEHEKTPKRKGGKVYIAVSSRGEVAIHEGYINRRDAARARRDAERRPDSASKPQRPELTGALQTYLDLHRHAAVRAKLLDHPGVALRLMVAHVLRGSALFRVTPEPQRSGDDRMAESVENAPAEAVFDAARRRVLALLDLDAEAATVIGGHGDAYGTAELFVALLGLDDAPILAVAAVAMGEALEAGGMVVEAVGRQLGVDLKGEWQPDAAFFDLVRDKEVAAALVADIAGEAVAAANAGEKVKVQTQLIRDYLDGTNGRPKTPWLPRWMAFPPEPYTARGGVRSVSFARQIAPLFEPVADDDAGLIAPEIVAAALEPDPEPLRQAA